MKNNILNGSIDVPVLAGNVNDEFEIFSQYDRDKELVVKYIAEINCGLDIRERADPIKIVMSLPSLDGSDSGLKGTKEIVHQYALSIRSDCSDERASKALLEESVKQAIRIANDAEHGLGKIQGGDIGEKSISNDFASAPYERPNHYKVDSIQVAEKNEVFTRGITNKDAKNVRGINVHSHFLGNPILRKVQVEGREEITFARMSALSSGQGGLFARGVDKIQHVHSAEEKALRVGHLDIRLLDPKKERSLYQTHKEEIVTANRLSEREADREITTCTLPVNSNDMTKPEMVGRGLELAFSRHPILMSTLGVIGGLIAVAGFIVSIPAIFIYLNNKQNKFKDEWNEARQGIDETLNDLQQRIYDLEDREGAIQLLARAREVYDNIYDGEGDTATKAAYGLDGMMLGVLMLKLAHAVDMTASFGCKSNKDRATMLDEVIQAQEIKWAKSCDDVGSVTQNSLLNFSSLSDQEIFRSVISQSDTRHTGERNTGRPGNMYFYRGIKKDLGEQYKPFVDKSLKNHS
ncbi:hypothetical protein L4C34_03040 [Vibrio profundum]|uniref:inositol phosphate phosphatase SopB n=1 Tax=Vibrio profundum TaxID=2910247 RepID=UPI003D0A47D7